METKDLLAAFKNDMRAAEELKNINDTKIQGWLNTYNGVPYGNEVKGRSEIVSRDSKKASEWAHASIIDPFVSTPDIIKASPVTFEDVHRARQSQLVLNTQFVRQFDRYAFINKSVKVQLLTSL